MKSNRFEKAAKISITVAMTLVAAFMVFGIVSFFYLTHDLPSIETLKNYRLNWR